VISEVPRHDVWGNGGIAPRILNLGIIRNTRSVCVLVTFIRWNM